MRRRLGPRGLRGQILLWSLLPTLAFLAFVAYFSFWAYSRVTEALVEDRNSELSRLLAGQMSLELGEYADKLADLREARAATDAQVPWATVLAESERELRDFDVGVVVLNSRGIVVAADARLEKVLRQDWSRHTYFRRLQASPAPLLLSAVEPNGPNANAVVGVAVAIMGQRGGLEEVIVGLFSVNAHGSSAFYRGILRLSLREQSRLSLVDKNGIAIYHSNPSLIGRSVLLEPAVQLALTGETGAVRVEDMEGEEMLASYAPIPGTECFVVEQESWGEVGAAAMGYGRWLVLILVLALVVPAVIVRTALTLITRPIQRLTEASEAMSRGEMHQIVDTPAAQELSDLAGAFNRMAAQLQSLYASLESRVRARTRELSAMNAIAGVVSASLDLHEIMEAALDKVLELMAMDGGTAYRLSAGGETLILTARRGRASRDLPELRHLPLSMISSRDALARGAIVLPAQRLPENDLWRDARREGWRQVVLVPLVSKEELLGVMALMSFTERRIAHSELALLTAIGSQIGVAVENGRLYQESGRLAAMAERNRLAQDLHDSVTQTIFTASLLAGVIPLLWDKDPEDARRQLEEVARLTRGALEEMRALLLELRPATMAQVPLEELLKRLAAATASNARLPVHLEADAGQYLPSRVRVSLYRIAQEAVNNVVKHAAASQVWISLRPLNGALGEDDAAEAGDGDERPRGVALTIRDDGQGFELGSISPVHLGLAIMRERAEDIRARLELTTALGQGTTVHVTWEDANINGSRGGLASAGADGYEADIEYERDRASWRLSSEEGEGVLDDRGADVLGGSSYE